LSDRINGRLARRQAHESQQNLSNEEEAVIINWIKFRALIAKPLDKHEIYNLVFHMTGNVPGANWIYRLQQRYKELRSSKPSGLDPKRAQNFNPANVGGYFKLLQDLFTTYPNLPPEHIWNMDEKGVQFGGGRKNAKKYFHLHSLKKSNFYHIRSDNLELMTIIECVSPSGLTIPPSFILSDGPVPVPTDSEVSAPIGAIGTSQNGWTDNQIGALWFKEQFIPFAESKKVSNDPVVLFLDGHGSHESEEFRNTAFEHGIIVIAFPSKCTHKLQPLDVVIYAQTQRQWTKHCDRRLYEGVQMDRYNIIQEYMSVRPKSMTPELLRLAFKSTGIYPLNVNVFTDDDFAPAKASSYAAHIPKGFPPKVATSSPIPSDMSDLEISDDDSESDAEATIKVEFSQIDWSTDIDDYKPPPSSSIPSMHGPSSPLTASAPPTTSNHMHTLPLPPDDSLPEVLASVSGTRVQHMSNYFMRSQASQKVSKDSSTAAPISIALDPSRPPLPKSYVELRTMAC